MYIQDLVRMKGINLGNQAHRKLLSRPLYNLFFPFSINLCSIAFPVSEEADEKKQGQMVDSPKQKTLDFNLQI